MGATTPRRLSPTLAAVLTFVAAASVLVLEIAAGRLLAPYVGVSLMTYTGIIGAILAGIALGAWLGGRWADAFGPLPLIGPAFIFGGLSAVASVPIVGLIGGIGLGDGLVPILVFATAGFVVPAAGLSAIGPMLVRGTLTDLATSGSIVGRLSAVGNGRRDLGHAPDRVRAPGTRADSHPHRLGRRWAGGRRGRADDLAAATWSGVGVVLIVAALLTGAFSLALPSPCDAESAYYCIAITTDPADPDVRILVLDNLTHAAVDLRDPTNLRFGYVRRFADATAPLRAGLGRAPDVLHVGGGGFTFPRYLEAMHPAARQTVLELDPRVLEIARTELGFAPSDQIDVRLGDARQSIRALPSDAYDLVIGDAFGGLAVPWHLTTTAFLDEVARVLRPDGAYVANLIDYPPLGFVRAEAATAATRFENVAVIAADRIIGGEDGGNLVLVASDAPIDRSSVEAAIASWNENDTTVVMTEPDALKAFIGRSPVLTDDFAPVDQLLGR